MAATRVTLAWDPPETPSGEVAGYRICWGTASGDYTESLELGPVTEVTVTDLTPGVTYYFATRTLGADGRESAPSNEVVFTATADGENVDGGSQENPVHVRRPATVAEWTVTHFTAEELADPSMEAWLWGLDADPDGDARSNAWEYALGSDPMVFDGEPVLVQSLEPGASPDERFAAFAFTRNPSAADAELTLEVAGMTGDFTPLETPGEELEGDAWKQVDSVPVSVASGARLVRLKLRLEGRDFIRHSEIHATRAIRVEAASGAIPGTTFAGAPLAGPLLASGVVSAAGAFTLTPATLPPPAGLLEGGPCYLVLTSGARAGTTTEVTGVADGAFLLGDDLSRLALPGDAFAIRRHHTLSGVFEKPNAGVLQAGTDASVADAVHFIRNDGSAEIHFRAAGDQAARWVNTAFQPSGDRVILPEEGFVINRPASSPVTLFQQGVPTGPGGAQALTVPVEQGTNLVVLPFVSGPLTLDQLGLFTGSPRTGVAGTIEYTTSVDRVVVPGPGGSSRIYFRSVKDGALGWYSITYSRGQAVLTPSGGVTLEPGAAFYIMRNPVLPAYAWRMPSAP